VFENGVLREVFGAESEQVAEEGWRFCKYYLANQIKKGEVGGA